MHDIAPSRLEAAGTNPREGQQGQGGKSEAAYSTVVNKLDRHTEFIQI